MHRRVLLAVALITCALAVLAQDATGATIDDPALISLFNLNSTDVQERCAELAEALDGRDTCGELSSAIERIASGESSLGDLTQGSLCASYSPDDPPAEDAETLTYLEEAILNKPVQCFLAFTKACEIEYDDELEAIAAYMNWIVTYSRVYTELTNGDESDIAPSCLAMLSASDISNLLGGSAAQGVQQYDGPDADKNTPVAVDWTARGYVTPVTSQSGGTCYAHASFNWAGSMALVYNVTDLSGQHPMTNETTLSPQAYLDCTRNNCDTADSPTSVLPFIIQNPSPANSRYPYVPNEVAKAKNISCSTPGNSLCTSYVDNSTLLYPLPSEINITGYEPVRMSESQMVQALATKGPLIVAVAVGDLMFSWQPPSNGTLQPMNGYIDEAAANPSKPSLCAADGINHFVLLTGYSLEERWFAFKNSWGTKGVGKEGYFYTRMSDPKSDNFTSPDYDSVCGLNRQVNVWDDVSMTGPPALAPAATAVSG